MSYMHPGTMPAKKKSRAGLIIGLVVAGVLAVCGFGVLVAAVAPDADNSAEHGERNVVTTPTTIGPPPSPTIYTPPAPAASGLAPKDVKLTVKISKKQCYGDIGCNVNFTTRADWPEAKVASGDDCEVTYSVRGLENAQVGTMTIHSDGTFSYDRFEYGSTPSESSKVTATATEVDCS